MRIPPASVILSWPTPNYIDPTTRGPGLLIVYVVLTTLVLIAVGGRFYSRLFIQRMFGADDWLMIPACVFNIGLAAVVILANICFGWDRHVWDVAPWMYQNANLMAFIAKFMFVFASTSTRLSLLLFYYRLIEDSGIRWFKLVLHASVAWTISVCIVFICLTIWLCVPTQCYWTFPPMENCQCLDEGMVLIGTGVANCLTDALVTLLPIQLVMRLQLPLKQRLCISIMLSFGVIVTIAGAIRTYFCWKGLIESWDETWWTYPLWLAAAVEIELATICACAPAWKSLLRRRRATPLEIEVRVSIDQTSSYLDSPWPPSL